MLSRRCPGAWCSWTVEDWRHLAMDEMRPAFTEHGSKLVQGKSMRQMTRRTMAGRKKSAGRAMFGGTRGWIAAGTLAAYAAMGGTKSTLAEKEKTDPAGSSAAEATLQLKKFDIAPGPLEGAVGAYEKATGLTVKVVLPAGTLAGFNSPGVVGLYREGEALRLLLDGTGLDYRVEDATTMAVRDQPKDTVTVADSVTDSL